MDPPESKVILLGDNSVGKTTILVHYTKEKIERTIDSTIGASFISKTIFTSRGPLSLHIWDTAGQEKYRSLIPMYSRGAHAAIIVLDISKKDFSTLGIWEQIAKENCAKDNKIYIVANKIDLEPQIKMDELQDWVKERGYKLFLTSAFDLDTIKPIFTQVAEDLVQSAVIAKETSNVQIINDDREERKSGCC